MQILRAGDGCDHGGFAQSSGAAEREDTTRCEAYCLVRPGAAEPARRQALLLMWRVESGARARESEADACAVG